MPTMWTPIDTLPQWTMTDLDILKRLQYILQENAFNTDADGLTFGTSTTQAELIAFMNQRQQNFLYQTGAIYVRATALSSAGQASYNYPSNKIHARSLTWQPLDSGGNLTGKPSVMERTDSFVMSLTEGRPPGVPEYFDDGSAQPTLEFRVDPVPLAAGQFRLMMVPQPVTLTGTGTPLSIPDEMALALEFGTLADFFSSDGESLDLERAGFCESLYSLIVDVASINLGNPPLSRANASQGSQQQQQANGNGAAPAQAATPAQ